MRPGRFFGGPGKTKRSHHRSSTGKGPGTDWNYAPPKGRASTPPGRTNFPANGPAGLRGGCPAALYPVAVTTAGDPYQVALDATASGEVAADGDECEDPCLIIGTWLLDNSTYEGHFYPAREMRDAEYLGVEGSYTMTMDREAIASATVDNFTVRVVRRQEDRTMLMPFILRGVGVGTYWPAGGVNLTSGGDYDFTLDGTIEVEGVLVPIDPTNFAANEFGTGDLISTASYICTPSVLYWTPPVPDLPLGLLQFNKVGD